MGDRARKRYTISVPQLNEFIFHCIVNAPQYLKNRLPIDLIGHTNSVELAKKFSQSQLISLDKKIEMYVRLGGAFSLSLHPPDYLNDEKLKEVVHNHTHEKISDTLNDLMENNVHVITDREMMAVHALMAQYCSSEAYTLNYDYAILATAIAKGEEINTDLTDIDRIKEMMEDHRLLSKLLLNALLHPEHTYDGVQLSTRQLAVLLYFWVNRGRYVDVETTKEFFKHHWSAYTAGLTVNELFNSYYLQKFPAKWEYAISGQGIMVLAGYVNRMANLTLNF